MIYLDYSATTKTDDRVLDRFCYVNQNFSANPNSNYKIAYQAKEIIIDATNAISSYLNVKPEEIIYTSGASESNNMVFKGLSAMTDKKHIITTHLEHSSVISTLSYLQQKGYKIDFVKLDENGRVDIDDLMNLIDDDTFLVSICAVDSELGIRQPVEEIGKLLNQFPNLYFHSDITQTLGKTDIDLTNIDLASFSGHKIYGFKGIGGLIKKDYVKISPLVHGGKSTTIFRSGTPQTELIDSIKTSMDLIMPNVDKNYEYVEELKSMILEFLKDYPNVLVNSNSFSIPHILNISILGKNSNTTQRYMASKDVYISTKTACSLTDDYSRSVFELYHDKDRASSSVRISLSYKTTKEEIVKFLDILKGYLNESD